MLTCYWHDTTIKDIQDCEIISDWEILIVAADNTIKNKHNKNKLKALFKEDKIHEFKAQYFIKGQKSSGLTLREYPKHYFYDDHTYEEVIYLAVRWKAILNINLSIKEGLTNVTIGKLWLFTMIF